MPSGSGSGSAASFTPKRDRAPHASPYESRCNEVTVTDEVTARAARRRADSRASSVISPPYLFLQAWPANADVLVVDLHGRGLDRFLKPPACRRGGLDLAFGNDSVALLDDGTLRKHVERAGVFSITPAGLITLGLGPGPLTGHGATLDVEAIAEYMLGFAEFAVTTATRPRVSLWRFQFHLVPAGRQLATADGLLCSSVGSAPLSETLSSGIVTGRLGQHIAFELLAWLWARCGLPERTIPFRHESNDALSLTRLSQARSTEQYAVVRGSE